MHRLVIAASLAVASVSLAAPEEDDLSDPAPLGLKVEPFIGFGVGAGLTIANHPRIHQTFSVPDVSLSAGAMFEERWSLSLEVMGTARYVRRASLDMREMGSVYIAAAGCTNCAPRPPGGVVVAITASFLSVGPRAEFAPFGHNGPYAGVGVGFASIMGLPSDEPFGASVTGRAGFRWRFFRTFEAAAELGVLGQLFRDASFVTPYASGQVRLYI